MLKEYDLVKEEIKKLKTCSVYQRFLSTYKTMSSYCLECRKNTESKNSKLVKKVTKIEECAVCGSEKSKFIKEQEARGLLCSLWIKTPLSKISLVGPLLF